MFCFTCSEWEHPQIPTQMKVLLFLPAFKNNNNNNRTLPLHPGWAWIILLHYFFPLFNYQLSSLFLELSQSKSQDAEGQLLGELLFFLLLLLEYSQRTNLDHVTSVFLASPRCSIYSACRISQDIEWLSYGKFLLIHCLWFCQILSV